MLQCFTGFYSVLQCFTVFQIYPGIHFVKHDEIKQKKSKMSEEPQQHINFKDLLGARGQKTHQTTQIRFFMMIEY